MLTILGKSSTRFCDRASRRDFLTIGGMALGGLALPQILRAESQPGSRSHKAIINVFLPGGPPHIDMWDLKPDAPADAGTPGTADGQSATPPARPRPTDE